MFNHAKITKFGWTKQDEPNPKITAMIGPNEGVFNMTRMPNADLRAAINALKPMWSQLLELSVSTDRPVKVTTVDIKHGEDGEFSVRLHGQRKNVGFGTLVSWTPWIHTIHQDPGQIMDAPHRKKIETLMKEVINFMNGFSEEAQGDLFNQARTEPMPEKEQEEAPDAAKGAPVPEWADESAGVPVES